MGRFDEIMNGLHEAVDYEKGKKQKAVVHKMTILEIPDFTSAEIKAVRNNANMTQNTFAACIGVTKKAVEAWECGRTTPDGAARRLIGLLQSNPNFAEFAGIMRREQGVVEKRYVHNSVKNAMVADN